MHPFCNMVMTQILQRNYWMFLGNTSAHLLIINVLRYTTTNLQITSNENKRAKSPWCTHLSNKRFHGLGYLTNA